MIIASDSSEWDQLVANSPQGSLFCETHYLELSNLIYNRYIIKKGNQTKAGICLIVTADNRKVYLDDLVIYGGIIFNLDPQKKAVSKLFEQFELTEFTINKITNQYDEIEIALAPQFEDMRPFLWYEYNNKDPKSHFELDLRYTSYIDISSL